MYVTGSQLYTCITGDDASFYSRVPTLGENQTCLELELNFQPDNTDIKVSFLGADKQEVDESVMEGCGETRNIEREMKVLIPKTAVYYRVTALPRVRDDELSCIALRKVQFTGSVDCHTKDICDGELYFLITRRS